MRNALKLFFCRLKPSGNLTICMDRSDAESWWKRNVDSKGERQIKMVRWSEMHPVKGVVDDIMPEPDEVVREILAPIIEEDDKPVGKETKVPYLRSITGGKGPPDDPEDPKSTWLSKLPVGTVFLAQDKREKSIDLPHFEILAQRQKAVHLYTRINSQLDIFKWVDPVAFSSRFDIVDILGWTKEEEEITYE